MIGDQWLLGLLILLVVRTAITAWLLWQRFEGRAGGRSVAEAEAVDTDAGTVAPSHCGTENEPGYRYYRSCVAELPGDLGFETEARSPGVI